MTINTNELRRLTQAAMHPVTKGRWMRLFGERTVYDRMEDGCRGIPVVSTPISRPHPFEAACLDFIAAANPAAISELLDRLEAAESARRDDYQNWMTALDRNAELMAKLEAAEKERDNANAAAIGVALQAEALQAEISEAHSAVTRRLSVLAGENIALRAKITEMERQEPVAWMLNCPTLGGDTGWILSWTQSGAGLCNRLQGEENEKRLYALPCVQTQEEEE